MQGIRSCITKLEHFFDEIRLHVERNGAKNVSLPGSEDIRTTEKIHEVREFYERWKSEAWKLRIPHSDVGCKILEYLINHPERWMKGQLHRGTSALFGRKPTLDDFTADLHAADRAETLKIIDTALGARDEKLKDSARRVIECAQLVKDGKFSTTSHRHCCAFGVPASTDGLLKCSPKLPPRHLLTARRFTPRGFYSSYEELIL